MLRYKPYEKALDSLFNMKGKETAAAFLEATGRYKLEVPLAQQEELYKKGDFHITYLPTNTKILIETEIKTLWVNRGKWQNARWNLHIPARKSASEASLFFVINKFCDTIAVIKADTLRSSPIIQKNTRNRVTQTETMQEGFFDISLSQIKFFYKDTSAWVPINPL